MITGIGIRRDGRDGRLRFSGQPHVFGCRRSDDGSRQFVERRSVNRAEAELVCRLFMAGRTLFHKNLLTAWDRILLDGCARAEQALPEGYAFELLTKGTEQAASERR